MSNSTLEQVVREKLATGYDPVDLKVSARGINEESLEVTIEGFPFSIKGNQVSTLGNPARGGATEIEPATDTGAGEATGDTVVSGESTEPAPLTEDPDQLRINKLLEIPGVAGYAEVAPLETGGAKRYALVDSFNQQLAVGTLDELEEAAKNQQPAA